MIQYKENFVYLLINFVFHYSTNGRLVGYKRVSFVSYSFVALCPKDDPKAMLQSDIRFQSM